MISFRASRQYTIVGLSLLASILGGMLLTETMLADIVRGTPDYECKRILMMHPSVHTIRQIIAQR